MMNLTWGPYMGESLSILLVLVIVTLSFIATQPVSRRSARELPKQDAERHQEPDRRSAVLSAGTRTLVRVDTLQRLRTDRLDLQLSVGRDFGAPELGDRIWPPIR